MTDIHDKLEALFEKVRALPGPEQEVIAETLEELTSGETYRLSDDELGMLMPELEAARRGEFAPKAEVHAVLYEPWVRRAGS
jgi:hypothetical protein